MADYVVDRGDGLESFMRRHVQAWRVPVLLASGGVLVLRGRQHVRPVTAGTALRPGDVVRVVEPPPAAAATALAQAANTSAHDPAWVPGSTAFDERMRGVMRARPATDLVTDTSVDSLRRFLAGLGAGLATNPVRDVIVVSHAHPQGLLELRLDTGTAAVVTYEDLEAAARARSIAIPPEHLLPRPVSNGQAVPARFLFRGCRIGQQPAYLRKLKEALGNAVPVIAPKHFHIAARHERPDGAVEYLAYGFTLARPTRFRNRAAAITAFGAGGFTRVDGSPVPSRAWPGWIPANITNERTNVPTRATSPITNGPTATIGEFRARPRRFLDVNGSFAVASDPGTPAARRAAVQAELERISERYRPTHPFPEWVRWGQASMQEFMDSWSWDIRYVAPSHLLEYNATRIEYTVVQPVVDVRTGRLFVNFYPTGTAGSVIEQLTLTDAGFFLTV